MTLLDLTTSWAFKAVSQRQLQFAMLPKLGRDILAGQASSGLIEVGILRCEKGQFFLYAVWRDGAMDIRCPGSKDCGASCAETLKWYLTLASRPMPLWAAPSKILLLKAVLEVAPSQKAAWETLWSGILGRG